MDALQQIEQHLAGQPGRPPLHLWTPELSGDITIVIKANGDWHHNGSRINRHSLVKLFASILRREPDQHYYLVTPVEKWRITVEDAPLIIIDADIINPGADNQQVVVTDNVGNKVLLGKDYRLSVSDSTDSDEPYPQVNMDNGLFAKVNRAVFYRLVENADELDGRFSLLSAGEHFVLGDG